MTYNVSSGTLNLYTTTLSMLPWFMITGENQISKSVAAAAT